MTLALPALSLVMRSRWHAPLLLLAVTVAGLLLLFGADAAALARIWWTSTTFGHCLFVGPVIAWLVWTRRRELARLAPQPWAPGLLVAAAGMLAWLVGHVAGVTFAREVGLVTMVQGAVVTLLGPNVARGLLLPLGYGWFLVPFGDGLERPLQAVTVAMVVPLLRAAGVPVSVDGVLIAIPNGVFEIAEACSGDKFVIAMLPFGVLVAATCFRRWRRRIAFVATSLIVPVLANGLRAFATIYAAHLTSVAQAAGADHIVFGWLFFGMVMAATLALGWRWFDRFPDAAAFDPARLAGPVQWPLPPAVAAVALGAIASSGVAGAAIADARAGFLSAGAALPDIPGWHRIHAAVDGSWWAPHYPGADRLLLGRYENSGGDRVDLAVALFADQREGRKLVGFGVGVLREEDRWVRIADEARVAGGATVRISAPGPVERVVATWYRVAKVTTADPTRVKLETLRARLLGGPQRAGALHLSVVGRAGRDPRAAIARFAAGLGEPGAVIDRLSGLR